MKRLWVILGALAMVCALNVTEAGAVKLAVKDIGWLDQTATDINARIKAKAALSATSVSPVDTTAAFSLLDCALPGNGKADGSNVDSTLMATLVFVTDTSASVTNNLTVATYTVQSSQDGVNWENVPTSTAISYTGISSGDFSMSIPLWCKTSDGAGTAATKPNPFFRNKLRVVFAASTGTMYAARAQLWYWSEN